MIDVLPLFALVAFVAIVTPGPTVLLALSNGSRFGARAALVGIAGAVASDVVLVAAAALGLGALLAASELWFSVVKWIGVAYLAWLGLRMLGSRGSVTVDADGAATATRPSARTLFRRSFTVAVTNPKGYLFVSAFLPQFIDAHAPLVPQYLSLGVVFCAIDFAVMLGYALLGSQAMRFLRQRGAIWLDRVCGGALLALAGSLAFLRRQSAT